MKEYGRAVAVQGPVPLPDELREVAERLMARNFELSSQKNPEWGLTDYEFRVGPVAQVYSEYAADEEGVMHGVPGTEIPDLFEHTFGWYASVED